MAGRTSDVSPLLHTRVHAITDRTFRSYAAAFSGVLLSETDAMPSVVPLECLRLEMNLLAGLGQLPALEIECERAEPWRRAAESLGIPWDTPLRDGYFDLRWCAHPLEVSMRWLLAVVARERVRLIPHADTSLRRLLVRVRSDRGPAACRVERHVSGDWKYTRRPQK
jgi:hypothetical protein